MENKIYESWAVEGYPSSDEISLQGFKRKAYVQGCNKMEGVCLKFAEWIDDNTHVGNLATPKTWQSLDDDINVDDKTTAELFQYFLNNVYQKNDNHGK